MTDNIEDLKRILTAKEFEIASNAIKSGVCVFAKEEGDGSYWIMMREEPDDDVVSVSSSTPLSTT